MKVLAFSDLHLDAAAAERIVQDAGDAELVIGAGDFAQRRDGLTAFMERLAPIADKAIYVAGNNEDVAELRAATDAMVLHGTSTVWQGLRIAGLGGAVPPLPPMAWRSYDLTEAQATDLLSGLPEVDVLVSHSPPHGAGDRHADLGPIGSTAVRDAALRLRPRLLLCGHVHDDWGFDGWVGQTRVRNLGPAPCWFDL